MTDEELLGAIEDLYSVNCAGCCLHIVLDDHNLEDGHVDFCIRYASSREHEGCREIGNALRERTFEHRRNLIESWLGYSLDDDTETEE